MYFEKNLFYRENLPLAFVHSFFPDFLKGLLLQGDEVGFLAIQPVNKENKKNPTRIITIAELRDMNSLFINKQT